MEHDAVRFHPAGSGAPVYGGDMSPRRRRLRSTGVRAARDGLRAGCCAGVVAAALTACSAAPATTDTVDPTFAPETAEAAPADEDPAEPLVPATPDEHSEVGDLVEGFPTDLLPVPPDAMILVTSSVPVGSADVREVSLNLRTQQTAEAVIELYRSALTEAGFTEMPPGTPQSALAAESTFTRSGGDELVSIGVLDEDGARTVTIGGRVRTEG